MGVRFTHLGACVRSLVFIGRLLFERVGCWEAIFRAGCRLNFESVGSLCSCLNVSYYITIVVSCGQVLLGTFRICCIWYIQNYKTDRTLTRMKHPKSEKQRNKRINRHQRVSNIKRL